MEFGVTFKFFEAVRQGEVSRLEIYNYLRSTTNDYHEESINLLLRDILEYYNNCREELDLEPLNYYETSIRLDKFDNLRNLNPIGDPGLDRLLEIKNQLEFEGINKLLDEEEAKYEMEVQNQQIDESDIDVHRLSGPDRLIYLKEIGFLDYLKNLKIPSLSNRKIAGLVAPLLGQKFNTAQPAVNSVLNDNLDKNNPYLNSKNTINAIRNYFSKNGIFKDDPENDPVGIKI